MVQQASVEFFWELASKGRLPLDELQMIFHRSDQGQLLRKLLSSSLLQFPDCAILVMDISFQVSQTEGHCFMGGTVILTQ